MVELSLPEVSEAMPRDGASHRGVEILITAVLQDKMAMDISNF